MKISFSQSAVSKSLQMVMGAVQSRVPIPSLSNVHLKLDGNRLELIATDLEVTAIAYVDVLEYEGSGGVLIHAKRFQDLIRELPDLPVEIEVSEGARIQLRGSGIGVYNLPGGDPMDFPELPSVDPKFNFKLGSEAFKRMVTKTSHSVSHDDLRPVLTGVLLQISPGELRMVTTDGHRLSRMINYDVDYSGERKEVIIPTKALNLITRNLGDDETPVTGISETRATFKTDSHTIITRLIDGNYPKYESIIPQENPNKLIVRTDEFTSVLRRVSIFSSQISHQVKLHIDGSKMRVESEDPEFGGTGSEEIDVNYTGESLEIAYNANYLMEILRQIDTEEVILELSSADDAAVIKPTSQVENEDFLMLLMPIRLR